MDRNDCREEIKESIEYPSLCQQYNREDVDEVVELIADILCSRTELLVLKSVIDTFESKIDIEFTDPQKKNSMHCSAKRYEEEIMQAIKKCDKMLNPV